MIDDAQRRERSPVPSEKAGEPWVDIPDGTALRNWGKDDEIAYNQVHRQAEKYRLFISAFDFIKENRLPGDYFEFGCHRVRTFRMALTEARRHMLDAMRFYAFDSFEGLPQQISNPSTDIWRQAGVLTTTEEEFLRLVRQHGIYVDHVTTVKGFYDRSLTVALQERLHAQSAQIALACIDCDLYESAHPVFSFIEPFLQEGSLLYIDDLFAGYRGAPTKGVARAFVEFQAVSKFKFVRHMNVGWWGRSYIAYLSDPTLGELSRGPVL